MTEQMQPTIERFLSALAQTIPPDDTYNEYGAGDIRNAERLANLGRYLTTMQARQPQAMLVMEAPGYRGCRLTGVPVTSRKLLREGVPELGLFGEEQGYTLPDDPGFERIHGEPSATIVWGTLAALGKAPLIWNTFPFHPHKHGEPLTNRRPRKREIEQHGVPFLNALLDIFRPNQVIAIGNVAHETLTGLGMDVMRVRHPSQGGKNDFVAGLTSLLTG